MEKVLLVKKENVKKVEEILKKDEKTSMLSIVIREGKNFGKEGFIVYLSGLEEYIERAIELTKNFVEELKEEEAKNIIEKLKEEEKKAWEGFGNIIG
ncbi:MAG: hypothetical protein QXQ14_00520 [Candidatus Aenigmatarchaeota archaeon]